MNDLETKRGIENSDIVGGIGTFDRMFEGIPAYVPASGLRAKCGLPYIGSESELDQWFAALRAAAVEELKQAKRISL